MQTAIPCMVMRGGTSKGLYFLASDLPENVEERNALLLSAMGSPDERQIDGMGGAHPLTSKVAVISVSADPDSDVDYLFLQVVVDRAEVSAAQNCGNILAGVGPFAIEQGLLKAGDGYTDVRINMLNTGARAITRVKTPGGQVEYQGGARIDGVPGTAAPVTIDFLDIAGSSCGALLPTGNVVDTVNGFNVTCIDNGMPVVLIDAADFDLVGTESPADLEANEELKSCLEQIRLSAGQLMNLGDVTSKTVPKMCLVSPPGRGGAINTRTFIPHRVHEAIGVLGSVSVASASVIVGSVANRLANIQQVDGVITLEVEHPIGSFSVEMDVSGSGDVSDLKIHRAALLRTARLLMRGEVLVSQDASGASV